MDTLINFDVDDLDRAERIYLLAKASGSQAAASADAKRGYERHWTPVHVDFVVDDIEAAVRRAEIATSGGLA